MKGCLLYCDLKLRLSEQCALVRPPEACRTLSHDYETQIPLDLRLACRIRTFPRLCNFAFRAERTQTCPERTQTCAERTQPCAERTPTHQIRRGNIRRNRH